MHNMGLLFDNKFPTKQFMKQVLGISESDWINNQPLRSLDSIKNLQHLDWKKLDIHEEIRINDAPKEFVQFAKVWKINSYATATINRRIDPINGRTGGSPATLVSDFESPILREKAHIIFGEDMDWSQDKMKAIKSLAMVFNKPTHKEKKEMYLRNEGLKIPVWAII